MENNKPSERKAVTPTNKTSAPEKSVLKQQQKPLPPGGARWKKEDWPWFYSN